MAAWRSAGVGLVSGLIFAAGLVLSGMTDPARVLAFLDFAGDWDPRLALVMAGAIGVHFSWLWLSSRRQQAGARVDGAGADAQPFSTAPRAPVTRSLVLGAAVFGVGWGLAGYCPGPAVVSLGLGVREGSVFLAAMLGGMLIFQLYEARQRARADERTSDAAMLPR
jgi:uncharacterized membrane protein YedE/YeeE